MVHPPFDYFGDINSFTRNDDKARIAEAKAKPVAARPEHTTAIRNSLNDIFCRFETIE